MAGLHPLDITVLVGYLLGITLLGVWMGRKIKDTGDFFMPKKFGKAMMAMHAFGSGTASDQAVSVASATARNGLSGIWYQWLWLFSTPFYWLVAPMLRRMRAVTTADVFTLRFDHSVAVLYALVGIATMSTKIGLILKGAGALVASSSGDAISAPVAISCITVLFVVYGATGGLSAAIVTDFIQGILTVLFSFMLLPFVLQAAGGMQGVRETIDRPEMLSIVAPDEISVFFVVMMSLQALVGIVAQPHIYGVCSAGKTEWEGRVGFMVGNFVKRFCTIAWCLTAIAAVAWYLQQGIGWETITSRDFGDRLYGDIAREFLPAVAPGLLGIFIATLLAAVMSSCDSFMISSSALFTENLFRPLYPDLEQATYVWVGRLFSLVVVAGGLLFAFATSDVVSALTIWFRISPLMGVVVWMSFFWRRMTVPGAWAATIAGFLAWWAVSSQGVIEWLESLSFAQSWKLIWYDESNLAEVYEPWGIVFRLAAAVLAGVVVSLVTKTPSGEKLDRFYLLLRTPVRPGELVKAPCTLPVSPSTPRPLWISWRGIVVPRPSLQSIIGFAVGWGLVAALIGGFIFYVDA